MKARKFLSRSALNIAALIVFVCSAFPVYWMVNTSFLPASAIKGDTVHMWPDEFTLRNYSTDWDGGFLAALKVSLSATGITLVVALLFAFMAALALSRFKFRSRKSIIVLVPFTIWTLRGFVNGVPADLEEAAMIDGCSRSGAFWRITFPLLAPGLVATGVFAFIQAWNEFVFALVIMNRPESQTLPIWLRTFVQATKATDWAVVMAGSTLMAIPVVIFFLIVQGRMTSSMVSGAVKG